MTEIKSPFVHKPGMPTTVMFVFASIFTLRSHAQSVPADLLDLSIEELFSTHIRDSENLTAAENNRWNVSYTYQKSRFEDYLDGSNRISVADVLFSPGEEPRTNKNFPVVPTKIEQDYPFSHRLRC